MSLATSTQRCGSTAAKTIEAVVVPVDGMPYRKTLVADERGSFLRALQACVGGLIEPMSYVFDDYPTVYCNEESKLSASLETANRAIYATDEMVDEGFADYAGEVLDIVFGDFVCVGFDVDTGEDRSITDEEIERVWRLFGSRASLVSGKWELIQHAMKRRL